MSKYTHKELTTPPKKKYHVWNVRHLNKHDQEIDEQQFILNAKSTPLDIMNLINDDVLCNFTGCKKIKHHISKIVLHYENELDLFYATRTTLKAIYKNHVSTENFTPYQKDKKIACVICKTQINKRSYPRYDQPRSIKYEMFRAKIRDKTIITNDRCCFACYYQYVFSSRIARIRELQAPEKIIINHNLDMIINEFELNPDNFDDDKLIKLIFKLIDMIGSDIEKKQYPLKIIDDLYSIAGYVNKYLTQDIKNKG